MAQFAAPALVYIPLFSFLLLPLFIRADASSQTGRAGSSFSADTHIVFMCLNMKRDRIESVSDLCYHHIQVCLCCLSFSSLLEVEVSCFMPIGGVFLRK